MRIFLLAWLRSRNILGLGISSLSLGLYFLLLGSIFQLGEEFLPFALTFALLSLGFLT